MPLPRAYAGRKRRSAAVAAGKPETEPRYVPAATVAPLRPKAALAAQHPPMHEEPRPGDRGLSFHAQVNREAARLGVGAYHTAIAIGSDPGYPDFTFWAAGGIMWREIKGSTARLTVTQLVRINEIRAAGGDAGIWWVEDWYDGTVRRELEALTRPRPGLVALPPLGGDPAGAAVEPPPARDPTKTYRLCGRCEYGTMQSCAKCWPY